MKIKKLKYGAKYFESEINNGIIFASDSEVECKANGSKSINTTITTFFPDIIAKEGYAHLIEHLKAAPIVRKVEKSKYKDKLIVDAATGTNDASGIKIVLHLKYNFSKYDGLSSRLKTDSKEVKEVLEYMDSIMQEYIENFHLPITQEDINKEIPIILSEREWSSTTVCDDLLGLVSNHIINSNEVGILERDAARRAGVKLFNHSYLSLIGFENDIKAFNAKDATELLNKLLLKKNTSFILDRELITFEDDKNLSLKNSMKFIKTNFPKTYHSLINLKDIPETEYYNDSVKCIKDIYSTDKLLNTPKREDIMFKIKRDRLKLDDSYTAVTLVFNLRKPNLGKFTFDHENIVSILHPIRNKVYQSIVAFLRPNDIPIYSFNKVSRGCSSFPSPVSPTEYFSVLFTVMFKGKDEEEIQRITKFLNVQYRNYLQESMKDDLENKFEEFALKRKSNVSETFWEFMGNMSILRLSLEGFDKNNDVYDKLKEDCESYINNSIRAYDEVDKFLSDEESVKKYKSNLMNAVRGMKIVVSKFKNVK